MTPTKAFFSVLLLIALAPFFLIGLTVGVVTYGVLSGMGCIKLTLRKAAEGEKYQ